MATYAIYARKSSESEERQVLSIDSQIRELRDLARSRGHTVADVYSEARSAKEPGRRPVFGTLLREIRKRKIDGILCWKLDRLARNPVDGAAIIWALEEGTIREIATHERTFTNGGDEKFWMQLEFGMAKKYVDDLSENVKRGNRAKLEQGWLPGMPPLGYLNDRVAKTIVPDPDRFELVRKIWRLVLAGRSTAEVLAIANGEWGLRTPRRPRSGNKPIARSTLYQMLSDPFYHGLIVRNGESYAGAHQTMITKAEFDRVQALLGRPNRRAPMRHDFAYTGMIQCGECGLSVTAEHKVHRHGYKYIYYHCTKRNAGARCSQPSIEVKQLDQQISATLGRIHVDDKLLAWARGELRKLATRERARVAPERRSLATALQAIQREGAALLDMRIRGLISDDEYSAKKREFTEQELEARERMLRQETTADGFEQVERTLVFANHAPKLFPAASNAEKREILSSLGSKLELEGGKLRILAKKPFVLMEERAQGPGWLTRLRRIRTWFLHNPDAIQWPGFCRNADLEVR